MTIPGSHQSGRLNYRQRVYAFLLARGPATIPQIAADLRLPEWAVRDAIHKPLSDTLPLFLAVGVSASGTPRGGRPRQVWDILREELEPSGAAR